MLDAARAAGGVPFGNEGDAHFVAFASAAAGMRAAVAAQRALASHDWGGDPVRVRMGLHTGEAVVVGEDYAGLEVHRAARVAAVGHGGQVLVTEATRLLAGDPGDGITLRDLGEHRLKDVARPERIYQVEADGLDTAFPAIRSLDVTPNNMPAQLTSFVGRAEVAAAVGHLERARLLTLTGPGGTGKTRLSLAVAAAVADRFPGGSWFVPLAAISDPDLVAATIAGTLGVLECGRDAARARHGVPPGAPGAPRPGQLRAGRRRGAGRREDPRGGPRRQRHRVQPGAAPDRRRAGVPGAAARRAARRRDRHRRDRRHGGGPAVR